MNWRHKQSYCHETVLHQSMLASKVICSSGANYQECRKELHNLERSSRRDLIRDKERSCIAGILMYCRLPCITQFSKKDPSL